jgi:hypothetical protein
MSLGGNTPPHSGFCSRFPGLAGGSFWPQGGRIEMRKGRPADGLFLINGGGRTDQCAKVWKSRSSGNGVLHVIYNNTKQLSHIDLSSEKAIGMRFFELVKLILRRRMLKKLDEP